MKKILTVIILIFCLYQLVLAQSLKRIGTLERKNDSIFVVENGKFYIANKKIVTVKLKSGTYGLDKVVQKIRSNRLGYIDLVVPEGVDLEKYVSVLEKSGKYDLVEYNNIGKYSVITNDTERSNQWYLNNTNAFNAWNLTMGSSNTTVAILDSGVDWRHPDIGNGSDGYKNIDEEAGWNYITNTNNVITVNGHGTRVAGIVAAKSNNFRGMSGMSGGNNSAGITMIPFCVGIDSPDGSVIDDAIIDAVDIGARVIQLSLNVGQTNAINAAIDYAVQNNAVIICASGNNYSSTVSYPASHQDVIAVGATNKSNVRADFSNYGISLDVVAPGVDILSTTLSDGYNSQDGTSFSAPQVSGIAALILSVRPDLTGQQVRNIIEQTAQKVGGYTYQTTSGRSNGTWNQEMGYGLVNAYAAVYAVAPRITGSSQICNQATYTINNFPSNATVQWSISPYYVATLQNNGETVTVSKLNDGGICVLTANITINNQQIILTKNIEIGVPVINSVEFINSVGGNGYWCSTHTGNTFSVNTDFSNITNYEARLLSWPNLNLIRTNSNASPSSDPFGYVPNGFYVFQLQATNTCGVSQWFETEIEYVDCLEYSLYNESFDFLVTPNPATNYITVSIVEKKSVNINSENAVKCQIISMSDNSMIKNWSFSDSEKNSVDISNLRKGSYIIKVNKGEHNKSKLLFIR